MEPQIHVGILPTMGTEKRARQKANRAKKMAEIEVEEQREEREVKTRRWGLIGAIAAGVIGLVVLISVFTGGDGPTSSAAPEFAEDTEEPTAAPEPTAVPLLDAVPDDFVPWAGSGTLAGVVPSARVGVYSGPPPMTIDTDKAYAAVIETDAGTIRLDLFDDQAPVTVNNFVNLARDGFYDGVGFHRVIEGFMAQGGDPTGTGSGQLGYAFEDEIDPTLIFDQRGILAMANSGPATNGSQFFITFAPTTHLNGLHTIFGQLAGSDTVLDQLSRTDSGEPATIIESITIIEA